MQHNKQTDDTVDISSVNEVKKLPKKFRFLGSAKKQKSPLRDEEGRFVAQTGVGGLKAFKKLDWKRALPLIAVAALVGGFFVLQSFAGTRETRMTGNLGRPSFLQRMRATFNIGGQTAPTSSGTANGNENQPSNSGSTDNSPEDSVLRRIYAEQMIPRGYSSNQYLQQFVHTGTGTGTTGDNPTGGLPVTIIDPFWTQASGRWDESWPEKIQVCAITYHQLPNNETSVQLSVGAVKQYNKVQVLQKIKNLNPPNKWPKQELCSDLISRTHVQPATPGTPSRTLGPASSFVINMKTVSVCAKEGQHLTMVYTGPGSRCHTSSFQANTHIKYPPYVPYVEQYIIKKAQ